MKRAPLKEPHARFAESAVIQDRCVDANTPTERAFAEVLADVLRVDHFSAESHFFEELGADSLVMAKFCARVRKRGDLPPVSMQDIYRYPTIRSLGAAFADATPKPFRAPVSVGLEAAAPTSAREYILCGSVQALFYLAYSYVAMQIVVAGYEWVEAASGAVTGYLRLVLLGSAALLVASAVPIAAKWLLIGRWKPQQMRIWSLAYVRFWLVKTLIRSSPAARLFIGTPLYGLYLRALGAKIGPGVLILSRRVPVCSDLLTIGAGAVIRREVMFNCYRAHAGRIEFGPVTLGRDTFVGERSVLDINTSLGDGAQLGHASALHSGQVVPAGERWHGCPGQRTNMNYVKVPPIQSGQVRRAVYSAAALLGVLFLYLPLLEAGASLALDVASWLAHVVAPTVVEGTLRGVLFESLIFSLLLFFGLALVGLPCVVTVVRVLNLFLKPDTVYPLYGFHDAVYRTIARLGRMRFYTLLFGDSSYVVHYLQWLGFHLSPVVQTGSNFGTEILHGNAYLSSVGSGTMVADALCLVNDEVSSTSFRVSRVSLGPKNFVGNFVTYPVGSKTGENVLLATKVMVPLYGKIRKGVGLLGAPCFEIPRTVERDTQFDHLLTGEAQRQGLAAKNRFNLRTMGIFLFTRWVSVLLSALLFLVAFDLSGVSGWVSTAFFALTLPVTAVYLVLVQRCVETLHPLKPTICSIYHPDFWSVERSWKVHPTLHLHAFDGTPFKNLLWRLMGVRVGKRVFDDGLHLSEPTLAAIGDECVLNHTSTLNCHSQEDGTFKCDRITIGAGCTLGVGAFVHYGVTMGDGSILETDSFLMKGEEVPPGARWGGNPAREL